MWRDVCVISQPAMNAAFAYHHHHDQHQNLLVQLSVSRPSHTSPSASSPPVPCRPVPPLQVPWAEPEDLQPGFQQRLAELVAAKGLVLADMSVRRGEWAGVNGQALAATTGQLQGCRCRVT